MRIALILLLSLNVLATPFKITVPPLAAANGNSNKDKDKDKSNNGNGNGNSNSGNSNSGNSNSGNSGSGNSSSGGSSNGGSSSSGSGNANSTPLLYSSSFISGRGSYQGGILIGETLQSNNGVLQNSGASSELQWVESLISGSLPTLPTDFLSTGSDLGSALTYSYTVSADIDYAYFMAKWGKSDNSSDHAVWLVEGGQTLYFQLPNGLSHSSLWYEEEYVPTPPVDQLPNDHNPIIDHGPVTRVSDGGSTFLILLGTLLPLEALRRRR